MEINSDVPSFFITMHACTYTYVGSSHRLVTCRHDWKYSLCGKSEIASVDLMNSRQNHFRHSQQRINTIIMINGNKIVFSPEIIIAHSLFLLLLTLSAPSHCQHSSLFDPICFSLNLFIISFCPSQFNSNISFKKEPFSGKKFEAAMCQLPLLSVPVIASASTPWGCFIKNQQETKSQNGLSKEGSECIWRKLSSINYQICYPLYPSIPICTCVLIHNSPFLSCRLYFPFTVSCSQLHRRVSFLVKHIRVRQ